MRAVWFLRVKSRSSAIVFAVLADLKASQSQSQPVKHGITDRLMICVNLESPVGCGRYRYRQPVRLFAEKWCGRAAADFCLGRGLCAGTNVRDQPTTFPRWLNMSCAAFLLVAAVAAGAVYVVGSQEGRRGGGRFRGCPARCVNRQTQPAEAVSHKMPPNRARPAIAHLRPAGREAASLANDPRMPSQPTTKLPDDGAVGRC